MRLAPSILAGDLADLAGVARQCAAGGADMLHVDVMDGHFVPNITIGPPVVAALRKATDRPLDVHLMIEEPDRYVDDFAAAGADLICVHVETCPHLDRTLQRIREAGKRPAVINEAGRLPGFWSCVKMVVMAATMTATWICG